MLSKSEKIATEKRGQQRASLAVDRYTSQLGHLKKTYTDIESRSMAMYLDLCQQCLDLYEAFRAV